MSNQDQPNTSYTSAPKQLPLPLSFEITKNRSSYSPRPGKKVNGMRATGPIMGCPGRKHCVFGHLCPVEIDERPFHWWFCAIELKRYDELAEGLRVWIVEARARPKIVDPEWLEELSEAYIEKQIFAERFRRYVRGRELDQFSWEYKQDPVVQRFEKRSQEQGMELRFYIHDLINLLRVAKAQDRENPLPGHHQRTAWWEKSPKPKKKSSKPPAKKSKRKTRKKEPKKKSPSPSKIYRAHCVRTIIQRRRRNAS